MKTLSANNQANIAATFHGADVLVEMTGISKQWSTKTRTSYETRIVDISTIRQAVDPLGGVAEMSDFTVTLQAETPTQFIQDNDVDNETVDVYLQYGSEDKITLVKGRLDRWELVSGGILKLHCIANLELAGATLPLQQINETNFTLTHPFDIPVANIGQWVPVTIGVHDRALGYMVDRTPGSQRIVFNADPPAIRGLSGSAGFNAAYVWMQQSRDFIKILTTFSGFWDGFLEFYTDTESSKDEGFVELSLIAYPIAIEALEIPPGAPTWVDPGYAIDRNLSTAAIANTLATPPGTQNAPLWALLRDMPFPESATVLPNAIYFLADCERTTGGNIDAANGEHLQAAIDLVGLASPVTWINVIADGDADFDNLNDMDDAETDLPFDTSEYAGLIGVDFDGDGTPDTLPVCRIGGRHFYLRYIEYQPPGGTTKIMEVREIRLRIDMRAEAESQTYFADLEGYADIVTGKYSGTAYAVIQNPADVVHMILDELLGFSDIATADFTAARSDLGGFCIAGQVLKLQPALGVLDAIGRQGKLKIFRDANDEWNCRAFTIPGTPDVTFDQDDGDFVGDSEDGTVGEIRSITQSPLDELYNQFEILYQWNEATKAFNETLTLDETTAGPIGDWLTESQSRYNLTRKFTVQCDWIRIAEMALSYGNHLVYMYADRKRVVEWQASWNAADVEIGDRARLNHVDVMLAEDTTVYAGYRAGSPLATIKAGYTDPDTSATIKAGAKVQLYEGRHQYEVNTIETVPMEGKIRFTGRQVDFSRSPLSDPI